MDNVLGTGAGLDEMPSDLGLVGVAGTLDAEGNTPDGTPAPIPGPAELKAALIKAAFDTQKGDPPQLVEVPDAVDRRFGVLRAQRRGRDPARGQAVRRR